MHILYLSRVYFDQNTQRGSQGNSRVKTYTSISVTYCAHLFHTLTYYYAVVHCGIASTVPQSQVADPSEARSPQGGEEALLSEQV